MRYAQYVCKVGLSIFPTRRRLEQFEAAHEFSFAVEMVSRQCETFDTSLNNMFVGEES